jgi:hypothetical protein
MNHFISKMAAPATGMATEPQAGPREGTHGSFVPVKSLNLRAGEEDLEIKITFQIPPSCVLFLCD